MPPLEFKSITVTEELYEKLVAFYGVNGDELKSRGVYSLGQLCTYLLTERYEEQQKLQNFARKITKLPDTVTILVFYPFVNIQLLAKISL